MTDSFRFDGTPVAFGPGASIAAALTAAGHRHLRDTAKGAARGMFCGMGVCQDCLVTVDGVPNQRACMTAAVAGQKVERQAVLVPLETAQAKPATAPARVIAPDVLILGGGAGGLSAAIAARKAGASVVVLDERKVPGGQYFKQAATGAPLDAQQAEGAALLHAARASGAEIVGGVEVWGAFDGLLFLAEWQGTALVARPKTVIVATGAYERPVMVPGWTLPGVMTTGAAQTLWRSYRVLPGQRVAVCGSGPLNLQVALELARGGAEVALVAEAAGSPFGQIGAALRLALAGPSLAAKGLAMRAGLWRRGVAVRHRTRLIRIEPDGDALCATFRGAAGEQSLTVDALCMNAGFEPQNEALRLLGAAMEYDAEVGHLRCRRDAGMRTTVPGLYAVGDCAGLGGAPAAMAEGRIAGCAAAAEAGQGDGYDTFADQRVLARHRRFQHALWKLHDIRPAALEEIPGDTLLCRCEEVPLSEARAALTPEIGHAGSLKRATRIGMGRCQGRYCGAASARLVAEARGTAIDAFSLFAPRVPMKPVSIAVILAAQEALDAGA
jgi:thioredoxin reductase